MQMGGNDVFEIMLLVLLVFGLGYNSLVSWIGRKHYDRGYTSFMVVGGVSIVLLSAVPIVGLEVVLRLFAMFCAAGLPMVVGSMARHAKDQAYTEIEVHKILKETLDDTEKTERIRSLSKT